MAEEEKPVDPYPRLHNYQRETEAQKVQRIRNIEAKRVAARTAEALRDRFGAGDD